MCACFRWAGLSARRLRVITSDHHAQQERQPERWLVDQPSVHSGRAIVVDRGKTSAVWDCSVLLEVLCAISVGFVGCSQHLNTPTPWSPQPTPPPTHPPRPLNRPSIHPHTAVLSQFDRRNRATSRSKNDEFAVYRRTLLISRSYIVWVISFMSIHTPLWVCYFCVWVCVCVIMRDHQHRQCICLEPVWCHV